jgi:hypothetical protein
MSIKVAFDVDGALIYEIGEKEDTPRYDIIQLFHLLEHFGCKNYVWSGGGTDHAEQWKQKLGLEAKVIPKTIEASVSVGIDITIDNEEIDLGKINIRV